jgi:AcrR family transcriptional regulator
VGSQAGRSSRSARTGRPAEVKRTAAAPAGRAQLVKPMIRDGGDDRRDQMLRAAVEVIAERGFPETRIADIGKRVGASSALVIYYFGTKDRLLTDALRYSEESFYTEVAARLDAVDTAKAKLEALVRFSCFEPASSMPGSWVLWIDLWAQALRHPELSRDREELDGRWRSTVQRIVLDGQATGELAPVDAELFALTFCALLDGLAVQLALGDSRVSSHLALDICMGLAGRELGFDWHSAGTDKTTGGGPAASNGKAASATGSKRRASAGRSVRQEPDGLAR